MLLLKPLGDGRYEALVRPGGKLGPGRVVTVSPPSCRSRSSRSPNAGRASCGFARRCRVDEAIDRYGHVPLPPYIDSR